MSEATDDSAQKSKAVIIRVDEIHSLADRLTARATSILLRDQPEQARDLALAPPSSARCCGMSPAPTC